MYVVLSRAAVLIAILCSTVATTTARSEDQKRPDSFDLLGYFPTSDTSGRIRPFQFRASVLSGPVTYFSKNIASDAEITANVQQRGFRIEGDHWFSIGGGNRRPIGVLADLQLVNVSELQEIRGDPISYTSGSLLFGWRVLGYGHSQPWTPEAALILGAAFEQFPVMQLSFDTTSYRLSKPQVLGARFGFRGRIPLLTRFQLLSLELGAYMTVPQLLLGDSGGELSRSDTRSMGANVLIDFKLFSGVVLGVGGYFGWFNLKYTGAGASSQDEISFQTQSFVGSVRVLF